MSPIINKKEGELTIRPVKSFAAIEITEDHPLDPNEARAYSRMKYGDPIATRRAALQVASEILKHPEISRYVHAGETIFVTSSAYGAVPTASHSVTKEVIRLLKAAEIKVKKIKFLRKGDFATNHYGTLNADERAAKMTSRKIFLRPKDLERISGGFVLVVDDINVTGSHERKLHQVLSDSEAADWAFVYAYRLDKALANKRPETEEFLNRAEVKSILDLTSFFKTYPPSSGLAVKLNSRVLKFILTTKPEGQFDVDEDTRITQARLFFQTLDDDLLSRIYRAAVSSDGYNRDAKFDKGLRLLFEAILSRDSLSRLHPKIQSSINQRNTE